MKKVASLEINILETVAHNIARDCAISAPPVEIVASAACDLKKVFDLPHRVPGLIAEAMLVQHLYTATQAAIRERMVWELHGHNVGAE